MSGENTKLNTALGFAMKAGRLAVGDLAAGKALKSGRAKLVAVDESASDNTKKKWADACAFRGIPLITAPGLASAIGKEGRMCAAVTDANFANMIFKTLGSAGPGEDGGEKKGTTEAMTNDK